MEKKPLSFPRKFLPASGPFSFGGAAAWLLPGAVAIAAFAVFSGALKNGFVNWDDDINLVMNTSYRGLGWTQLKWMFSTFHMGHYQPLSWITFALDYKVWGMDPAGYHLTAILLHAANAAVFYFVSLRLLKLAAPDLPEDKKWALRPSAAFAALLFAVQPLRVVWVAWATERRDVLSGLFYLFTALYYLKACAAGRRGEARGKLLGLSLSLYALSLLSKGIGVSLPAVLMVLDVYPLRRLPASPREWLSPGLRKVWLEKVPFALLSLAAGITGMLAQVATGATDYKNIVEHVGVGSRFLQALYGIAFYVWKTALPAGLLPLYERPFHSSPLAFLPAAAAVLGCSAAFFLLRRRWPALLAVWVAYVATLIPVLQVFPFGPYIVADRYTYLACLGWAVLAGGALLAGLRAYGRAGAKVLLPAALSLTLVLGWLSAGQTRVWRESGAMWRYIITVNPDSSIAHSNLGCLLLDAQNKPGEAIEEFRRAIKIRSDYGYAYYNYGNALAAQGKLEDSLPRFRDALKLMPDYSNGYYNLGNSLMRLGRTDEAIVQYREALRLSPDYANAYHNLGTALLVKNDIPGALELYFKALRFNPSDATTNMNLANTLARQGRFTEAVLYYYKTVGLAPRSEQARDLLALALISCGRYEEAAGHFRAALRLAPGDPDIQNNFGTLLLRQGKRAEAAARFREALRLAPGHAIARANLDAALRGPGQAR
jgi:tetratricopeptide (TPR) repeat protein